MQPETNKFFSVAKRRMFARGKAEAVLRLLAACGHSITPRQRRKILACTDLVTLDRWIDRALARLPTRSGTRRSPQALEIWPENEKFFSAEQLRTFARGWVEGWAESWAEGWAETVLTLLRRRGLAVTLRQRRKILACTDLATLDGWFDRAVSAASVAKLLR